MIEIYKDGRKVSSSRNLRGIMTYARKHGVKSAKAIRLDEGEANLWILFGDGAECLAPFASYSVCVEFIRSRRSWSLVLFSTKTGETEFVPAP